MSKRVLPITSIVTSAGCGHCVKMRMDGRLLTNTMTANSPATITGGYHFNYNFIYKLLTGGVGGTTPLARVINLHTTTLKGDEIQEYSEFFIEQDTSIRQEIYRPQANTDPKLLSIETLTIKPDFRSTPGADIVNKISATWSDAIKEKVPVKIKAYMYSYPSIMVFSGENWQQGLQGNEMYGVVLNAETRTTTPYGIIRESVSERPQDPMPLYQEYILGKKSLIGGNRAASGPALGSSSSMAPTVVPPVKKVESVPKPIVESSASTMPVLEDIPDRKIWIPTGVCKKLPYKINRLDSTR